ncbi:MAG: polyribonucleotide nucleotidyltransferase [bacterium]
MKYSVNGQYGDRELHIETGKAARQANGSVVVTTGENVMLVTAVASRDKKENQGFFPLMVDYREQSFATGKIPGGFIKREGRPKDKEILASRLIDRPIRPLFPDDFLNETQIVANLLSADGKMETDILGVIGASAALMLSDIPFNGPIGGARIAIIGGEIVANPTFEDLQDAELDLVLAGTETTVTTIEAEGKEVSEDDMLRAIEKGHEIIRQSIEIQKELLSKFDIKKMDYEPHSINEDLKKEALELIDERLDEINAIRDKQERTHAYGDYVKSLKAELEEKYPDDINRLRDIIDDERKRRIRKKMIEEKVRLDGRKFDEIRDISCEAGLLPRAHGSALFTRGETQSIAGLALGTAQDEQIIEELVGETSKSFMLHYNFPPYSVGEVKFLRGPGRREIGHGYLAEKALAAVIPAEDIFPYTIRIVSEILESNGSSSMASVCSGSIALMDAGIPVKTHVAGIAMGLVRSDEGDIILTDILGEEDHYGDMDFKVAGTTEGITALQLDTKIQGIDTGVLSKGFAQAKEARLHILSKMEEAIAQPRKSLSKYAPRLVTVMVDKEKIGKVIGPGGKTIRGIIEETGVKIDIDDEGKVTIASDDAEGLKAARKMIEDLTKEAEPGEIYTGKIVKITDFGAFIEIFPGTDGMMHISKYSYDHIKDLRDHINVGDEIKVKVTRIDKQGRIDLSRKALIERPEGDSHRSNRNYRGDRDKRSGSDRRGSSDRRGHKDNRHDRKDSEDGNKDKDN